MPIRIAVIGAGAFGRNHIRLYRELPAAYLAAIVDPDPGRIVELAATGLPLAHAPDSASGTWVRQDATPELDQPAIPVYPTTEALLAAIAQGELQIDAASVCTPTSTHHAVSSQLLQAGIHVLVEKPIASTLKEADDLIALSAKHDRILTVGHLERFNPAVQATLPLLRGPMFFEAHRLSVFSPRSLDTDVVLDLMIHDLDIVLTLTGNPPVTSVHAVGLPILSGRTDIANVRVEFSTGCVANFTASRVSTERVRKLRFFQPHQYLSLDYARQDLLVIEVQPPAATSAEQSISSPPSNTDDPDPSNMGPPAFSNARDPDSSNMGPPAFSNARDPDSSNVGHPDSSTMGDPAFANMGHPERSEESVFPSPLPTLSMSKPSIPPAEPLRLELESFLHSIQTGVSPEVSAPQAREALALALQIQQAIEDHARHTGLQAFTAG